MRRAAHVAELPEHVLVEGRAWQPTVRLEPCGVRARVRVDGEEIEPAVAVVVDPADAPAHHRLVVVRHPEPEPHLPEGESHRRRYVLQAVARGDGPGRRSLALLRMRVRADRPPASGYLMQAVGR